jgi:cysteine desulfurase
VIYFDHNATTPVDARVLDAMLPFLHRYYGNPASLYKLGRLARSAIDTAREQIAALVGAQPAQVIFTSGGTEANALALHTTDPRQACAISAIEHPSISEPAARLQHQGHRLQVIPVNRDGLVLPEAIADLSLKNNDLVSIMLANNETGCLQNLAQLTDTLRAHSAIVHTDAVQAVGKIPVNFATLGVQRLSLSSHKLYGPKGCGALIVDNDALLEPLLRGGEQEKGRRAGTENVAAIVGFGKAAELAAEELNSRYEKLLALRLCLEHGLAQLPGITIFAQHSPRLPNTVQFGIAGIDGEMLLMQLDEHDIAVSSGSACASGGGQPSPVLTAMGIERQVAKSAIRISLGMQNTEAEIAQFLFILQTLIKR